MSGGTGDLFGEPRNVERERAEASSVDEQAPLAERLRPADWEAFQSEPAFDATLLAQLQQGRDRPPSLVLWGPPGSGKTTFAKLVGRTFKMPFVSFSAVLGGVKEVREIVDAAKKRRCATLLFVDEIHRFNKAQQDAFLPHVESGLIVLIGATTENPSFCLTGALLSRVRVVVFPPLGAASLRRILDAALTTTKFQLSSEGSKLLISTAGGDARRLLNLLESLEANYVDRERSADVDDVRRFLADAPAYAYDRAGDQHYDMVSAFIKSLRGSNPDAALYWGFRMLEGGEDPRFLTRRMMIFASEDVGNADPQALSLAVATADAFERLGNPEGRIPIAHCIVYLATAPKSNRAYLAMHAAVDAIKEHPRVTVPMHLRNAPTGLMKDLGHGAEYQYPHDSAGAFVAGVSYLPPELGPARFYNPGGQGAERRIGERMAERGQRFDDDRGAET